MFYKDSSCNSVYVLTTLGMFGGRVSRLTYSSHLLRKKKKKSWIECRQESKGARKKQC